MRDSISGRRRGRRTETAEARIERREEFGAGERDEEFLERGEIVGAHAQD